MSLARLELPYSEAFDVVAAEMVARESAALPNLAHCIVVLPSLKAAPDLYGALARAARGAALLLPGCCTLRGWAAAAATGRRPLSTAERELQVYAALRRLERFRDAALWPLAREVVRLADECTRHGVALPREPAALSAALHAAYRARRNRALQFEAELVHELWRALTADPDGALDAETAYLLQLGALAGVAQGPLYVVGEEPPTRAEREFLAAYAERAPVVWFERRVARDAATQALCAGLQVFLPTGAGETLEQRARALQTDHETSPLAGRLALYAAGSLEDAAAASAWAIRRFLADGAARVALVALDRSAARRVRALLERADVLMQDEEGWKLSTTSAGAVAMRWLEALDDGFYHRTLVDLMRSPFVFADWTRERRAAAVLEVDAALARYNLVAGLESLAATLDPGGDAAGGVTRLRRARDQMKVARTAIPGWIDRLFAALGEIGALQGLRDDHAGSQLLDLLQRLRGELSRDATPLDRHEFEQWLDAQLEQATFKDVAVESPVVLTQLGDIALRRFDAVVLLGADALHLPAPGRAALFGPAARADLGLPGAAEAAAAAARQFVGAIGESRHALVVWQTERGANPNPASPFLSALTALHLRAYGTDLTDPAVGIAAAREEQPAVDREGVPLPARRGPASARAGDRLPGRMSVSAWQNFVDCPYRFFAGSVLGLAMRDEVQEEADKGEYGRIVHAILDRFHRDHPVCLDLDNATLEADLRLLAESEFAAAVERNRSALAWKYKWLQAISGYITWQQERERGGWRFAGGELTAERDVAFAGGSVRLNGRIDRVDRTADGRVGVIDYKTQAVETLRKRAGDPGDHVQLSCYALLSVDPIETAEYVALDVVPTRTVPLELSPQTAARAEAARIGAAFAALRANAPMPANGVAAVCSHCDVRGLCRRGHWMEADEA